MSVRLPVMLSPPKPLDEIQTNMVCAILQEWGVQRQICLAPPPGALGRGSKDQISLLFNYKVNFKDVYTQLCVCSHKWKIQNISDGILILEPGSCPRGRILGTWGAEGVKKWFFSNMVMWHIKSTGWRAEQNASKIFILGSNWWHWGEVKRSNIIKFR